MLASFQGVSAFWTRYGLGRDGGRGADVSARYVRSASALMKEARPGVGGSRGRVGPALCFLTVGSSETCGRLSHTHAHPQRGIRSGLHGLDFFWLGFLLSCYGADPTGALPFAWSTYLAVVNFVQS